MILTSQQGYELLAKHGCYATDCCDRCGQVLGPVRFTRRSKIGIWCSRECRGDGDRTTIRKGGRPKKYKSDSERHRAERGQNAARQRTFRALQRNGKPFDKSCVSNGPQTQKSPLSHYPLTPHHLARKTADSAFAGRSV
jgi:hypothetical protein